MARIRSVKPNLFGSYSMARVPIEARFLFIGLFCEADDEGVLIDSPKRIAGAIFPHDEKVTEKKVDIWLNKLQEVGSVFRYETKEGRFLMLPEWGSHQKISHALPSQLPSPSAESLARFLNASGNIPEENRSGSALNGKGKGN